MTSLAQTAYIPPADRVNVELCPISWGMSGLGSFLLGSPEVHLWHQRARNGLARLLDVEPRRLEFCSSGTAALRGALRRFTCPPGSEVIVSSFNCPRVVEAILEAGFVPRFCDVGDTLNCSVETVEAAMTPKSKVVLATHVFGHAGDIASLADFCTARRLLLIDDAAQAFSQENGRRLGTRGDFGIFSFGRHKPIYAHGGGALLHPEPDEARPSTLGLPLGRLAIAHAYAQGFRRRRRGLAIRLGLKGQNALATDVVAALEETGTRQADRDIVCVGPQILAQELGKVRRYKEYAAQRIEMYYRTLRSDYYILPPRESLPELPALLPLQVVGACRRDVGQFLSQAKIESTWMYYPLHQLRQYRRFRPHVPLPGVERTWPNILCVPLRGCHSRAQIRRVICALNKAVTSD